LHRRGSERAWWQKQGIDPLPVAAALWKKIHEDVAADTEATGDSNALFKLNGHDLANQPIAVRLRQNDETKSILGPEAE
jgi:hypothetical protein